MADDWKVLQLGASQYGWESFSLKTAEANGFYHPRILETTGSFAIAIDMSIADEIIEAQESFEAPFDLLAMGEIYEKYLGKCFVSYPNIVMPDVEDSSIRNGRCQYTHAERVKWSVDNFEYPYPKPSVALVVTSETNLQYLSSFNRPKHSNVDLRLYKMSSDGLRPVHHKSQVNDSYDVSSTIVSSNPIMQADFLWSL